MDLITQQKVEQFAARAAKARGWEWCGVQEAIPPALPLLVIQKWGITKRIRFEPENFEPIKTATLLFAPEEKKMTDTSKLNLRQKMIQIYNEIDHVGKYGKNQTQKYNFVRAADVMRPVRNAFAKFGVYAETNFELLGTYDIKTNSGGNMHTATVKATIVLHDTDSYETLTISGLGDGADSGDKGIFKAQTGAVKNALRNGTLLPDEGDPNGGDPEADESVDTRTTGNYAHNASTTELPDFQDAQRGPARGNQEPRVEKSTETTKPSPKAPQEAPTIAECLPETPCEAPETVSMADLKAAIIEHGDAYEAPEADCPPTETELTEYRAKFKLLGDDLSVQGKLTANRGLPINRKLLVFLLSITKAPDAKTISKSQWDNFFSRVDAAKANAKVGLVGLTKLVNKANGLDVKE